MTSERDSYIPVLDYSRVPHMDLGDSAVADLALERTLRSAFPDNVVDREALLAFFRKPLTDVVAIRELSLAQEALISDTSLFTFLSNILHFCKYLAPDGGFRRTFTALSLASVVSSSRDNDGVLGATRCLIDLRQEIVQHLSGLFPLMQGMESFPLLVQNVLNNVDQFLQQMNELVCAIDFRKNPFPLNIVREAKHDMLYQGRWNDLMTQAHACLDDIQSLVLCFMGEVLFHDCDGTPHWLLVLVKMAEYQKKYQALMSRAVFNEDGVIETHHLHHPSLASSDIESIPQECLRVEGDKRMIVLTGLNSYGKTTLARALVQLFIHNQLGSAVFGKDTSLPLATNILTYQEADIDDMGKLAGEFARLKALSDQVDSGTIVFIDEFLRATLQLPCIANMAQIIVNTLIDRGARVILVTHNPALLEILLQDQRCCVLGADVGEDVSTPTHTFSPKTSISGDEKRYTAHAWKLFSDAGFVVPSAS